jgi:hypothetical protein
MCLCQYEDEPEPTAPFASGSVLLPAPSDHPAPYVRTTLCARTALVRRETLTDMSARDIGL